MFELKLQNKTIPLKWGTWAMRRACELAGEDGKHLPLQDFFDSLLNSAYDFRKIAIFLQAAAESATRGPVEYTEHDYGDWLDECGGILATSGQIIDFFNYVIKATTNNVTPLPGEADEKKKRSRKPTSLTWDDVLVQAVQCGLSIDQFWNMTWREWSIHLIAHQRDELNEWARVRRIAYMVYVMGSSEKIKMKEEKFHPLPIDEPEYKGEPITMEQFKKTVNLYSTN